MEYRRAKPADAEGILEVLARSARAAYADLLEPDDLEAAFLDLDAGELRDRLERIASEETVVYLVAADDGEVRGFAQFRCGDRAPDHLEGDAFLQSLYVLPDRWNEGIGGELLAEGVARLPGDAETLQLSVFADNDPAKCFYENRGFERTGGGTFEIDGTAYETDVYTRDLD